MERYFNEGEGRSTMNIFKIYWRWLNKTYVWDSRFEAAYIILSQLAIVVCVIVIILIVYALVALRMDNIPADIKPSLCEQINELSPKDKTAVEKYVESLYTSEGKVYI